MKPFLNSLLSRKVAATAGTWIYLLLAKLPNTTRARYATLISAAYLIVNVIEKWVAPNGKNPPNPSP